MHSEPFAKATPAAIAPSLLVAALGRCQRFAAVTHARSTAWLRRVRRRRAAAEEAAWLERCEALAALDVRHPIDVVFVDVHGRVQRVITRYPRSG